MKLAAIVIVALSILTVASAQCGSSACKPYARSIRQCGASDRPEKCKLTKCGGRKWRCERQRPNTEDYRLIVEYSWSTDETDLDTSIKLFGEYAGRGCGGSKYVIYSGDNPNQGGNETYDIKLGQALKDRGRSSGYLEFNAIWFGRQSSVPATLYTYLVDGDGKRIASRSPIFVRPAPGLEGGCASNIVGSANVRLSPTPQINLKGRIPTELYLIANFTMTSVQTGFDSSAEYAGQKNGIECGATTKYIMPSTKGFGIKRVDSYVFDVTNAKKDGFVGDRSVAKLFAGWHSISNGPDVELTAYLLDGSGRRYPTVYDRRMITPGSLTGTCNSHLVATANIIYSNTQVRLSVSL